MWDQKNVLSQELADHGFTEAAEVVRERYQELVNSAQGWWTLMRLFKKSQFTTGLLLSVKKTFEASEQVKPSVTTSIPAPVTPEHPTLNISEQKNTLPSRKPPSSKAQSCRVEDPCLQVDAKQQAPVPMTAQLCDQQLKRCSSPPLCSMDELKTVLATKTQGIKRRRSDSPESAGEVNGIHGHSSERSITEGLDDQALACSSNRRLNLQLVRLAGVVPALRKREANTMALLLEGLLASQERGTLAKVAQGLVDNMPVRWLLSPTTLHC